MNIKMLNVLSKDAECVKQGSSVQSILQLAFHPCVTKKQINFLY